MEKQSALEKIKKLDAERAKIIEDAKAEALTKAQEAVDELNSLGFVYVLSDGSAPKRGKGTRTKSDLAPKYRNPKNPSQVWSGKGRMAGWMAELIENDKKLKKEDFANPERA